MDDIGFHHQVLINKLGRVFVVGVDTANFGSRQNHLIGFFGLHEGFDRRLISQIQLVMCADYNIIVTARLQLS